MPHLAHHQSNHTLAKITNSAELSDAFLPWLVSYTNGIQKYRDDKMNISMNFASSVQTTLIITRLKSESSLLRKPQAAPTVGQSIHAGTAAAIMIDVTSYHGRKW